VVRPLGGRVISGYRGLLGDVVSRKAARDAASTPPPRGPQAELNGRVGPSAAVEVASPNPPWGHSMPEWRARPFGSRVLLWITPHCAETMLPSRHGLHQPSERVAQIAVRGYVVQRAQSADFVDSTVQPGVQFRRPLPGSPVSAHLPVSQSPFLSISAIPRGVITRCYQRDSHSVLLG
jgi:hypothetical protein